MQLTGSHQERVEKIIQFALENNKHKVSINQIEKVYQTANIPFIKSARVFFEKYSGLFKDCYMFTDKKINKINFEFNLLADTYNQKQFNEAVTELNEWYSPNEETSFGHLIKIASFIFENFGKTAIPLGYIGYYYSANVWITEDNKLFVFHEYNDYELLEYNTLKDFLCTELLAEKPCRIEFNNIC
ncbi:MAG: hypothetical protein MJ211_01415 [Bacteroidales bacterium]|nr:hypothetical protein [Bacteroidales bacterium]